MSSFIKENGSLSKLLLFVLLALSCLSLVTAAPTGSEAVNSPDTAIEERELSEPHNALPRGEDDAPDGLIPKKDWHELQERSAGLAWGPVNVGNLKLYLTNPHDGYAGPKFPNANHVNFHVDKKAPKNTYTEVVNMHIVKYSHGGKSCLYAWDSVTKKTVFDNCYTNFGPAIREAVQAIKGFVDGLLRNADFIASVAVIAALVVALAAAIASAGVVALA